MKKSITQLALIATIILNSVFNIQQTNAQAPQAIPFQAVARDISGNPLLNQNISLQFRLRQGSAGGSILYTETHSTVTNSIGSFTVNIGLGTIVTGTFTTINWGNGSKFIQVEMDPAGGVAYLNLGTQQMLSVPYALLSATSTGSWSLTGNAGTVDGTNFIGSSDNVPLSFKVNNQKAGRIDQITNSTFFGYQCGNSNNGLWNTASGYQSFYSNTSGQRNNAFGYLALYSNKTGNGNNAMGDNALNDCILGSGNSAFGANALNLDTSSSNNTAVGNSAGTGFINGNQNTFIGFSANANAAGYLNSTCLGANSEVTASNQVRIGGSGVTSIGGSQNWSNTSDGRIKFDVQEDVPGLNFIKMLRPVTYNKSIQLEYEIIGSKDLAELSEDNNYEKIRYSGFIAQEVEKAAKEVGYDFSGVDAPKNEKDLYSLRYAEFVVPMVKAIQEQQSIIENQKMLMAEIKLENENLRADNASFKSDIQKIKTQLRMDVRAAK